MHTTWTPDNVAWLLGQIAVGGLIIGYIALFIFVAFFRSRD